MSHVRFSVLLALMVLAGPVREGNTLGAIPVPAMARYFVNRNAQRTGEHEVHRQGCSHPPAERNRIDLGKFDNCRDALRAARQHFRQVDGCFYCSKECHTR